MLSTWLALQAIYSKYRTYFQFTSIQYFPLVKEMEQLFILSKQEVGKAKI